MPKKITNYLTEGLPAKIYLQCYLQPQSGYALAKSIYNNKITTAKIYGWTKRLVQEGYLSYDDKRERYSAKPAPMVSEIKNILKSKGLGMENAEYRDLISLLESDRFKTLVQKHWEPEKTKESSNILELVSETISAMAAATYFLKTIWEIPDVPKAERKRIKGYLEANGNALSDSDYKGALEVMSTINEEIIKAGLASKSDFQNSNSSVFDELIQAGAFLFVLASRPFLETLSQLTPAGALIVDISKIAKALPGIIEASKKLKGPISNHTGAKE